MDSRASGKRAARTIRGTNWVPPRCHHPLRYGDRLYVSYWHHGFFILDISDLSKPKPVVARQYQPGVPASDPHLPAHAAKRCKGRNIMVVADEDVAKLWPSPPSFAWVYDITNEHTPVPIATFRSPASISTAAPQPAMTGCHQPSERFHGTVIPFAWFAQGLRLVDFADPFQPQGGRPFLPEPRRGRGTGVFQRRDHRLSAD